MGTAIVVKIEIASSQGERLVDGCVEGSPGKIARHLLITYVFHTHKIQKFHNVFSFVANIICFHTTSLFSCLIYVNFVILWEWSFKDVRVCGELG